MFSIFIIFSSHKSVVRRDSWLQISNENQEKKWQEEELSGLAELQEFQSVELEVQNLQKIKNCSKAQGS